MLPLFLVAALATQSPETPETLPPDTQPADVLPHGPPQRDYQAPWREGRSRLSFAGGATGMAGATDFYFAMTYGYFIVDNLELGFDTVFVFGDRPFTARVGPGVLYVVPLEADVQPYVGGFYRHWFVADDFLSDLDTLGARLGIMIRGGGMNIQLGMVAEGVVSECEDECMSYYPEIGFSLSF